VTKKYDLIIFDWDGTILDSEAHIIHCMANAIGDESLPIPSENQIKHIIGLSLSVAIPNLIGDVPETIVNKITANFKRHFFDPTHEDSELFEGVSNVIAELHTIGYYLAVATGKGRRGLDIAFQTTGLGQYFHLSRCADETRSKPDPMMLDEILADLDLPAERAIMIGDTSYDIEMANNIKMDSIAVTYGMHDKDHLKISNPTHFLDDIQKLYTILT